MSVTDDAIARIRRMIATGRLRPGDRLPPEGELSAQLGLSRNSLREAVRALSLLNVLDVRRGDGTYVTSLAPRLLLEPLAAAVGLQHGRGVLPYLEVRRILEPQAAAMAALRMDDADVRELGLLVHGVGEHPSRRALAAHEREFHGWLARASGNPVLAAMLDALTPGRADDDPADTADDDPADTAADPESVAQARTEHRWIVAAVAARQPDLAESWARVHVATQEQRLRRALGAGHA